MIIIASIAFIYYSRPVRAVCSPWLVARARHVSKEFEALMARQVSKEFVALKARPSFKRVRSLATKVRRARHISKGAKGKRGNSPAPVVRRSSPEMPGAPRITWMLAGERQGPTEQMELA